MRTLDKVTGRINWIDRSTSTGAVEDGHGNEYFLDIRNLTGLPDYKNIKPDSYLEFNWKQIGDQRCILAFRVLSSLELN